MGVNQSALPRRVAHVPERAASRTRDRSRSRSKSRSRDRIRSKSLPRAEVNTDARFDAAKRITVNGIRKLPLVIPEDSKRFGFDNEARGTPMCWMLATDSASQFVKSGLKDASAVFTRSTEINIYFPAFTRYFAVKSFQSQSGFTLAHIMKCIEATALGAMAYYIKNDLPKDGKEIRVTASLVKKLLRLYAMCAINIKGNKVYCITADV